MKCARCGFTVDPIGTDTSGWLHVLGGKSWCSACTCRHCNKPMEHNRVCMCPGAVAWRKAWSDRTYTHPRAIPMYREDPGIPQEGE